MTITEMLELIRWDIKVNRELGFDHLRAILLLIEVRIEQFIYQFSVSHPNGLTKIIWYITRFFGSIYQWLLCNSQIPGTVVIGRGLRLPHPQNLVFRYHAEIGEFCTIYHNVSIIWNGFKDPVPYSPRIGNRVLVGTAAIIIGDIAIGDESLVGAGAILSRTVPYRSRVLSPAPDISSRREPQVAAEGGSEEHLADPYSIWR